VKMLTNNLLEKDKLLKVACLFLIVLVQFLSETATARSADHLEVRRIRNFNFGSWVSAGSVSMTRVSCLSSANDNSTNPSGAAAQQMPYQVKVESLGPDGNFYIYLDGDTSNTGNKRILVNPSHRDINDPSGYEQLMYNSYDNHSHVGNWRRCRNMPNNSELRMEISGFELDSKVSGRYSGDFRLTGLGGSSGTAADSNDFRVLIRVQASPKVQINSLENLSLGSHSGLGNIYAEENFCIYSTSTSGSYTLSVSSANQDGSGSFFLDGSAGQGQIPYALSFIDNATGPGTTQVSNNTLSGFGNSSDQYCGGSNNATLSVNVNEADLQAAKSGSYQDSLIILVEPQ
jgi:hypothetical protein